AQTGSGKTLAFGLPMLVRLHTAGRQRTALAPRGLVLVPTRELAQQVADELAPSARALGLRVTAVFGGASIGRQIEQLHRGVDAVTPSSTPVELMDHRVFLLAADDKISVAAEIATRPARTLFFVRTKHGADRLAKQLTRRGIDATAIHGNLNQNQRTRALDGF